MAQRQEQVNVRLTKERKQRWKQAAAERERPLTQFIRWCVEQEITGKSTAKTDVALDDEKLDTIIEEIQSLDSSITGGPGSIAHRLSAIESEVRDNPQEREIATTVYGLRPDSARIPRSQLRSLLFGFSDDVS